MNSRPLLLFIMCILFCSACKTSQSDSFTEWYAQQDFIPETTKGSTHSKRFLSGPLLIDTIYRSMQGPFEQKKVSMQEPEEEILWLTAYSSRIINAENNVPLSDGFMCHNNMDINGRENYPWRVKTKGTSTRLFTLTEGQTSVNLPPGFGIPVPADHVFEISSQVLNHNIPEINLRAQHEVTVEYLKGSETSGMIPLYQQAVFVTKQETGPAGDYGHPINYKSESTDSSDYIKMNHEQCTPQYDESDYNPYQDAYGRRFTGHWKIPLSRQVLRTDVTKMLDLEFNTTIHYIGVHLHPFAKSLELWDVSADSMIFRASVNLQEGSVGILHIDHYSDSKGIPVFRDHRYQLVSTYECTDSVEQHTAMATMFLYLRDQ